jgi:hypothetical protein
MMMMKRRRRMRMLKMRKLKEKLLNVRIFICGIYIACCQVPLRTVWSHVRTNNYPLNTLVLTELPAEAQPAAKKRKTAPASKEELPAKPAAKIDNGTVAEEDEEDEEENHEDGRSFEPFVPLTDCSGSCEA